MKHLIICPSAFVLFLGLFLYGCDKNKDVDYFDDNRPDVDYIIRNDIDHSVLIVMKDNYEKDRYYSFPINYKDSLVRNTKGSPFFGNIYLVIDDTIKYQGNTVDWHYNLEAPSSYDTIEVGDNYYKMRYVIDEDFYEYAKAHPYKGE